MELNAKRLEHLVDIKQERESLRGVRASYLLVAETETSFSMTFVFQVTLLANLSVTSPR